MVLENPRKGIINLSIKIRKYYLCQIYKQSRFVNFYKSYRKNMYIHFVKRKIDNKESGRENEEIKISD